MFLISATVGTEGASDAPSISLYTNVLPWAVEISAVEASVEILVEAALTEAAHQAAVPQVAILLEVSVEVAILRVALLQCLPVTNREARRQV